MKFKEFLKENYQGNHRPPNKNNGAPLYDSQKEAANIWVRKYK